jgi:hypothetical protein
MPRLGADALWWSFPLGSAANLVIALVYYRHGGWRKGALAVPEEERAHEQGEAGSEPAGRVQPAG